MNKIIFSLVILTSAVGSLFADVLRIEGGLGLWNQEVSGPLKYLTAPSFDTENLGYTDENRLYAWVDIKHPIAILPNLRFEYTDIEFSGTSGSGFIFNGKPFPANTKSTTAIEQVDTILYYNILDNTTFTTLDLGLDFKYIDASFDASSTIFNITISTHEQEQLILPLVYGRLRFDLPLDMGIEAEAKYMQYKASSMQDYIIKLDYTLVDVLPIDLGLELGYRFENVDLKQADFDEIDFDANLDVDGFFAGVVIRF